VWADRALVCLIDDPHYHFLRNTCGRPRSNSFLQDVQRGWTEGIRREGGVFKGSEYRINNNHSSLEEGSIVSVDSALDNAQIIYSG